MIIGLSGYANSGKNFIGDILMEQNGFEQISFAAKLKECLYALNPIAYTHTLGAVRVQELVNEQGWDDAKESYPEIRELLQRLGTEVGRDLLGENIWVDAAFKGFDDHYVIHPGFDAPPRPDYVVTDLRFPNEYQGIQTRGGVCVRITRPGYEPTNPHISETALDGHEFDFHLDNSGDLVYLQNQIAGLLSSVGVQ